MLNNFVPILNTFPTKTSNVSQYTIATSDKISENIKTNIIKKLNTYPVLSHTNRIFNFIPLKTIYGESVKWNGNYIVLVDTQTLAVSLSVVDKETAYENRKMQTALCFLYSKDGLNWNFGSYFYNNNNSSDLKGQWSGNLVMREGSQNQFDLFYTHYEQSAKNIVHISGSFNSDLSLDMNSPSTIISPDDLNYATWWMNKNNIFQDPYVFVNPYDGYVYCLFSGSVALGNGTIQMKDQYRGILNPGVVESNTSNKTGVIGLSRFSGNSFDTGTWTNLSPILSLCGVSSEAMNPILIFKNSYTYLLFGLNSDTSNVVTGLYGFYSENGIFGDFVPLNSDGLVLSNTSEAPDQIFNFIVDDDLNVYSIIRDSYSFTPAPTTKIILDRENAYVGTQSNYGYVPPKRDWSDIYVNSNPY